jgi:acetoin:2,6-dichlorophenolindophenol oxidoreductase subunit alpha
MAGGSLISDNKLKQLYTTMLHCRLLTEHARRLNGKKRDLYSACLGQEAMVTGCAIDLRAQDTVLLAAHQPIAALAKGVKIKSLTAALYEGKDGDFAGKGVLPFASDIATQFQLGNQLAATQRKGNVVVAFLAMPATGLDEYRTALKSAAKSSLPVVYVVENNPWPAQAKNGLRPALAEPLDGVTNMVVDGNDVVAVYRVAYESLDRVRQGGGPVVVEARTYHQDGQALPRAERDPLTHMERYLSAKKLFTPEWKNQQIQQFTGELNEALAALNVTEG